MKKVISLLMVAMVVLMLVAGVASAETNNEYRLTNKNDGSLYNTGKDNGYSEKYKIVADDEHFGWSLGYFKVSNYTSVIKEDNIPIFLVNAGDKISLDFVLEQNIDCLNGNKNLAISDDTNGYNVEFQIAKQDFGRGMLIVNSTDSLNNSKPVPYKDFLSGVSVGANTNINNMAEGDYEVVLNYEIVNKKGIDSYTNYCVRAKFKVRNSNCMVFVRDVNDKTEIANNSVAKDGFKIDYANSKYLQVTVKRNILTENGKGKSETTRMNRSAYDGAKYTEEGIYYIKVKNRYTNEQVEYTIAVGENELINAYVTEGCVYTVNELDEMIAQGIAVVNDEWSIEMVEQYEDETDINEVTITLDEDTQNGIETKQASVMDGILEFGEDYAAYVGACVGAIIAVIIMFVVKKIADSKRSIRK